MSKKDKEYWSTKLDKFSYKILREAGTEMPFSGKYNMHFENGVYKCCLLYTSPSPRDQA